MDGSEIRYVPLREKDLRNLVNILRSEIGEREEHHVRDEDAEFLIDTLIDGMGYDPHYGREITRRSRDEIGSFIPKTDGGHRLQNLVRWGIYAHPEVKRLSQSIDKSDPHVDDVYQNPDGPVQEVLVELADKGEYTMDEVHNAIERALAEGA